MNVLKSRTAVRAGPVLSAMETLLGSTKYACAGTGIDVVYLVFKMYPRKMVDLVAEQKGWRLEDVPIKMIRKITHGHEHDGGATAQDKSGFCLDYERRDVAKSVLGGPPGVCVCCGSVGKLKMCGRSVIRSVPCLCRHVIFLVYIYITEPTHTHYHATGAWWCGTAAMSASCGTGRSTKGHVPI